MTGKSKKAAFFLSLSAILSACGTVRTEGHLVSGSLPLCAPGVNLGRVSVSVSPKWRPDQKEPERRELLARQSVEKIFSAMKCGAFGGMSEHPAEGMDTHIDIEIRELGPELILSVPVLWSSNTDVDLTMRVADLNNGNTRLIVSEHRKDGGPFELKTVKSVAETLESMLYAILYTGHHKE